MTLTNGGIGKGDNANRNDVQGEHACDAPTTVTNVH